MRYNNEYIEHTYGKITFSLHQAKIIYGNTVNAVLNYALNCMEKIGFTNAETTDFAEYCLHAKFSAKQLKKECENMIDFCKDNK